MVHFVTSVYSGINSIARDFNRSDIFEMESGTETTRNWIPIGTGTLFKVNVLGLTALFIMLIPRVVTGCHLDKNQNELMCRDINDNMTKLACAVVTNMVFVGCRLFRNNKPS